MLVCPSCRTQTPCCGWEPRGWDYLSQQDRASSETSDYRETYDLLARRNLSKPLESNEYVEGLASRFTKKLNVTGKDFCDVGSGRGFAVKHALRLKAKSVTAVDISETHLKDVAKRYPEAKCFLANAESLPFEREFDVLSATDILEHVLNVANFLCCANWALRDGGTLGIRVPNLEPQLQYSNYHGLPVHFTHLRTFDKKTLIHMLEGFGFKVKSTHYDGFQKSFRREPVEIGAIATKVSHIQLADWYADLRKFKES